MLPMGTMNVGSLPDLRAAQPPVTYWWAAASQCCVVGGRVHLSGLRLLTAEWRPTAWGYVQSEDRALNPQSLALTGSAWEKPKVPLIFQILTEDTSAYLVCVFEIQVLKLHFKFKLSLLTPPAGLPWAS